jgi:excisionase family DNA binding protein
VHDQPDFTVQEVARLTQRTIGTIYRLCESGQIRSYRLGRGIRIPREYVEQLRQGLA